MDNSSRREVLVALAVCGCGTLCASEASAQSKREPPPKPGPVDVGAVADYPTDGVYESRAKTNRLLIVRKGDTLHASSSMCTHRSCVVKLKDAEIVCPCHGSRFDLDGIPIEGQAKVSLPRFAIKLTDGKIIVDTSKTFEEMKWEEPDAKLTLK